MRSQPHLEVSMQLRSSSLVAVLTVVFGATVVACSSDSDNGNNAGGSGGSTAGSGGSSGSGGRGGSGAGGGSGGTTAAGGSGGSSGSGGSGGSSGGSGGSTGGSSGSGGSTGGAGGSSGSGGTSGSGGSSTDAAKSDMGGSETGADGSSTGALVLTVEGFTAGPNGRNCYPPGANDNGNKSPKMDWGPTPPGTMSWVLTTEDKSDMGPHQVVCNIPVSVVGQPADVKAMIPAGAESGTRHNKPGNMWYGPGAGNVRQYEVRIWAIATDKLAGGCKDSAGAVAAFRYLRQNQNNKQVVIATDGKTFWGNRTGACQ
jgi:phosphatidylethanolamine-binding protein (PEBP) family uncharacterized protein